MIKSYEIIEVFDDNYIEYDFKKEDFQELRNVYENYKKSLLRFMDAVLKDKFSYLKFSEIVEFTNQFNEEITRRRSLYIHVAMKRECIYVCWQNIYFKQSKYYENMLNDLMIIRVNNDIGVARYA